jgi:branched-chain amino acid transport system permease protein
MTSETLFLILLYFALASTLGGLALSWRFSSLNRDAMNGAFAGFGAAVFGLGLPGLAAVWFLTPAKVLGLGDAATADVRHSQKFRFETNVLWGMGAFGLMWAALMLLALNTTPSRFAVVVAGGLYEGMLIFLVAAGLSIIFGLMDVLNFAQGALFAIGAYTAVDVFSALRPDLGLYPAFLIALIAATLVGGILGVILEVFLIRPTYSRPLFQMVLTFGVALAFLEVVIYRYGHEGIAKMDLKLADGGDSLLTGLISGTRIQSYWVFMILIGLIMMVAVQYLLQNTRIGIIIRAGVQDSEMVEALGVNVRLIFTLVFAIGTALAALGGGVASGFLNPTPGLGDVFLLQAIAVIIIGGLGSYTGTAVASIVIGISGAVASHFAFVNFSSDTLGPVAVLLSLLLVLYIKPTGLFGQAH